MSPAHLLLLVDQVRVVDEEEAALVYAFGALLHEISRDIVETGLVRGEDGATGYVLAFYYGTGVAGDGSCEGARKGVSGLSLGHGLEEGWYGTGRRGTK